VWTATATESELFDEPTSALDPEMVKETGQIVEVNEPHAFFDSPRLGRTRAFLSQILR
jgi:ABC-type polar amino acid transport system ATPase subunit